MKTRLLALIALLFTATLANAQDEGAAYQTAISIGAELGFPSRSVYSIGYGASAKFELPIYNQLGISLTGGYSSFAYKGSIFQGQARPSNQTFVPLKAGIIYYGSADFFLEAEAGAVLLQSGANELSQNLFAFSFGPSLMFRVNDNKHQRINVGLRYEKWSRNTLQQIAVRAAYRFGW